MKFSHPYLLNLLWFFLVAFGIITYGMHQRKKIMKAFIHNNMMEPMVPGYSPGRRWAKSCLILFASVLCIVALAGPLAGFRWEKVEQKGVDIMIALDCSNSMLAQDIKPDRLSRAKHEIVDLLRKMKSDRAGLVAFAGRAILQCPLTLDYDAFHVFLNVLEPGYLPVGGTNLDDAVQTAFDGFEKDSITDKAIILITDGENTTGDVEAVAKQMAAQGVKIFAIGVGDPDGAPIPDKNGGFKKDAAGGIVMSKVDETVLKKIASMTGGAYVRSVAGDMDLDLIYEDKIVGTMERKELAQGRKKVWENRFQWLLLPGIILLLIEFIVTSSKPFKGVGLFFIVCLIGLGQPHGNTAHAGVTSDVKKGIQAFEQGKFGHAKKHFIDAQLKHPDDDKIYYNIGTAAYMNKEYDIAAANFRQAAGTKDATLKQKAMYNLANTQYRMGKLEEAIKGYEDLLKQFPDDIQAKENLEFVQNKKKQQEQQPPDKKSSPQNDSSKDQKEMKENQNQAPEDGNGQQNQAPEDKIDQPPQDKQKSGQPSQPGKEKKQDTGKSSQTNNQQNPNPDQVRQKDQPNQGADRSPGKQAKPAGNVQHLDQKLNRLEDKPGQAMMPQVQKRIIEKDW